MEQLRLLGCRSGQGYHLARPLAPRLIAKMLAGSIPGARGRPGLERASAEAQTH